MKVSANSRPRLAKRKLAALSIAVACSCFGGDVRAQTYQSHFLYLDSDPSQYEADWTDRVQGITHDDTHWYITQTWRIWQVPVSRDLGTFQGIATPGVVASPYIRDIAPLDSEGYNHFGDPSYYHTGANGYLMVPIEGGGLVGLAAFHVSDLSITYIDHLTIDPELNPLQTSASWCGIDPLGRVFFSNWESVTGVFRYTVDWTLLDSSATLDISLDASIGWRDAFGFPLSLDHVQGGAFTEDGALLYVVADDIFVFDTLAWRLIRVSNNGQRPFNFEYDTSFPTFQEPEGLTVWNLEGTASAHSGQLHVLLLDKDDPGMDDIFLKHYTHRIVADAAAENASNGTPSAPFSDAASAVDFAWNGAEIQFRVGIYPGAVTIAKSVRLTSDQGMARIGG